MIKRPKRGKYDRHDKSDTKIYNAWKNLKARCKGYQKKQKKDYKDRGITFCERWKSFNNFYEDMGEVPEGMSLDRIDNDKGYSKENCRWATGKQQMQNQRPLRTSNKSGVKGVCWAEKDKSWLAYYRGKIIIRTKTFEEAVQKRKQAEIEDIDATN